MEKKVHFSYEKFARTCYYHTTQLVNELASASLTCDRDSHPLSDDRSYKYQESHPVCGSVSCVQAANVNHANIAQRHMRARLGSRAYSILKRVHERAHTLIGYCTTVTRRLIRKWSGQLCDDVNNNPCATILQTKLTDAPCKSALLYRGPIALHLCGLQRNESDGKRCFREDLRELHCCFICGFFR